ncbi:MAG: porin, partial [Desulfobacteraceae bacterium]|nr:porin [Desulfobacteraceae bacterium]
FVFKDGKPGRIIPLRPFRLKGGGWGAFQIGARLEQVKGDQGLLTQGFVDPSKYTNRAAGVTFGINWYPVDMVRVMLNYYHMDFGDSIAVGNTTIDDEDVIMTRVELAL